MISVSNLKINFKQISSKHNIKKNELNILFLNNFKEIKYKPTWLNKEIENFLITNSKARKIKQPYLFETQFGLFLMIPLFNSSDDYSLDIENQGGVIFDKISPDFYNNINFYIDDEFYSSNLFRGLCLKSYKFENYKSDRKQRKIKNILVFSKNYLKIKSSFQFNLNLVQGVYFARDLVWKPANILNPKSFAEECKKLKKFGVKIKIFNESNLKKIGMTSLLAVGQGSRQESNVVLMEWSGGKKNEKPLTVVGKGVCFDSGGLSLKPAKSMEDMKWDMGGAATVTGLLEAISRNKIKKNVIGIIGLVENMPDGNAQRPGDVIKSFSGKTIEVLNTDAEGRLVLADLLSWAEKNLNPAFMIDLATLTGAMIVSLGKVRAGLFCNDNKLTKKIEECGERTGDKVWSMPLDEEYDKMINTEIADMKNIGGLGAGSITAACFLKRHIKNTPWAHLDIAGVTWLNNSTKTSPSGASGWGVKLLFELIRNFNYKN